MRRTAADKTEAGGGGGVGDVTREDAEISSSTIVVVINIGTDRPNQIE